MKTKTEIYVCPACGGREEHDPGRHWCECAKNAPFEMMPIRIRRVTKKVIAQFTKKT